MTPFAESSAPGRGVAASAPEIEERCLPQDLVMTMLAAYMRGLHETVWSGGLVELLAEFGFSVSAARTALNRLADRELLERVRDGRTIHYRLTAHGERVIAERERRILALGEVPAAIEAWTMVWHRIPEAMRPERSRLVRRLRFLGFGHPQECLWVSPHDKEAEAIELLEEFGVADRAGVLVSETAPFAGAEALVERAWDLETLCWRYRAFAEEFAGFRRGRNSFGRCEAFRVRTRLTYRFSLFSIVDPGFPDRLLPEPGARDRALEVFAGVREKLEGPARCHFDRRASRAPLESTGRCG